MKEKLLIVEIISFEELPSGEENFVSNNGCGKEYANYLIVRYNGKIIRLESNAMEPEDVSFYRDLKWVKDAIEEAYELGRNEVNL